VWSVPLFSGYTGPTVADGRVYVMDMYREPKQTERVLCYEAATGKPLWRTEYRREYRNVGYDAGPRASVLVYDGVAYSLGAMGDLYCRNAETGKRVWNRDLNAEYQIQMPEWGISASPIIEGELLIVMIGAADGACLLGLDRNSGAEKWRALDDRASYSAPIVIDQAGKRVLVVYTGDNVAGLDPQTGKVYWKHPFPPRRMPIGIATPVVSGDQLFLTNFFDGSMMLRLHTDEPAVSEVWKRAGASEMETDALHSIISTPIFKDEYIYGVDSYGELRCLNAKNGDRVWESLAAVPKERWATIHFVQNASKTWMLNDRGELIIAELSPQGYKEISRAKLLDPTKDQLNRGDGVVWAHPAFANKHVFARNDKELVCASLAAK
jgi:outer membrane protein assembly factor BamB